MKKGMYLKRVRQPNKQKQETTSFHRKKCNKFRISKVHECYKKQHEQNHRQKSTCTCGNGVWVKTQSSRVIHKWSGQQELTSYFMLMENKKMILKI